MIKARLFNITPLLMVQIKIMKTTADPPGLIERSRG